MSGRGVRYRMIPPSELDKIMLDAMRLTNGVKDASPAVFRNAFMAEVLPRMVVAVTEPVADLFEGSPKWQEPTIQDLQWDTGGWKKLFTSKDTDLLTRLFAGRHELPREERSVALARMNGVPELWLRGTVKDDRAGKLVRYRMLDPDVIREAREAAAREIDKDANYLEYRTAYLHMLLPQMVTAVSAPVAMPLPTEEIPNPKLPEPSRWTEGPFAWGRQWDEAFTPQETLLLEALFTDLHEVTDAEVEILAGKEMPVSTAV